MRTTLDIDADILQAAKELAAAQGRTAGKIISELARKGLTEERDKRQKCKIRNGVPVFESRGEVITRDRIRRISDQEGV